MASCVLLFHRRVIVEAIYVSSICFFFFCIIGKQNACLIIKCPEIPLFLSFLV